jgi:hypothetical protein
MCFLQLINPVYAQVHSVLPQGWQEEIDERHLSFKPLPLINDPFEVKMDSNGMVSFKANI